jgi:hypothetical protein
MDPGPGVRLEPRADVSAELTRGQRGFRLSVSSLGLSADCSSASAARLTSRPWIRCNATSTSWRARPTCCARSSPVSSPNGPHADEGADTYSPFDVVGHLIHGEETDWVTRTEHILAHGATRPFVPFDR